MLALAGAAWLSSLNGGMTIMKRTIYTSVSVLALFAAAPAMAQSNGSTVTQSGAYNDAAVAQNGSNASSTVEQTGNGTNFERRNIVEVIQSGNSASSTVSQSGSDRNEAEVIQNGDSDRSEEHTSELQSLMRISYAVFCLKKKKKSN